VVEKIAFKAHARLLTMLGEQLIKNERIALVELVKNAYDADATLVTVDFRQFGKRFEVLPQSAIVITDNGTGMSQALVRTTWMNPATPSKAITKRAKPTTDLGRVLQGEKGIGRFASFKLGGRLTLTTRGLESEAETTLLVDIQDLREEAGSSAPELDYFLEDVAALLDSAAPRVFDGTPPVGSVHGTQLEIGALRAEWNEALVREAFRDLDRMQPLMWADVTESDLQTDFVVDFLVDGTSMGLASERSEEFKVALDRAVLHVRDGRYEEDQRRISFVLNDREVELSLDDEIVRAKKPFSDWFLRDAAGKKLPSSTSVHSTCGSFGFEFYIFDFSTNAPSKYSIDKDQRLLLKDHRVYLYRDGVRVYPYGDPDDDWLEIDVARGTESAGRTFSNDQTVGYVTISQAENPNLRDKTNREGLLESGRATGDFKALIQTILRYLRAHPYEQYASANRRAREQGLKQHRLDEHIQALRRDFDLPDKALKRLDSLERDLAAERELSAMQVGRTEQLAGVGLSVETASHDLIAAGSEALRSARQVVSELKLLDLRAKPVFAMASTLVTQLEFISARFKDVQGLFVSTRQRHTGQDVVQLLRRVRAIYAGLHEEHGISFEIDDAAVLRAPSTEAAVLQCLINLVDNATYWLMLAPEEPRVIRAFTPTTDTLVFTDSGPGVREQDAPFIFEAFYSGKGEDGKGLGLYIARQNGLRNGFSIELKRTGDTRELAGATFSIRFGASEGINVDS
jgi:signal transduction histidine kinase